MGSQQLEGEQFLQCALAVASVLPCPASVAVHRPFRPRAVQPAVCHMRELPYSPMSFYLGLNPRLGSRHQRLEALKEATLTQALRVQIAVETVVLHLADKADGMVAEFEKALSGLAQRLPQGLRLPEVGRKPSSLCGHAFAAIIPGDSVAEIVLTSSVLNFLNIYNTLLICRLILTWFPQAPEVIVNPLSTLCDPYLNVFRGIIPPLGGTLDFSPILAFVLLNAFTNAATALPAEMPKEGDAPRRKLTWRHRVQYQLGKPLTANACKTEDTPSS